MVTRRSFLAQAAPLALAPWVSACAGANAQRPSVAAPGGSGHPAFLHGVASGDPLPNAVILWTRVSWPSGSDASAPAAEVGAEQGAELGVDLAIGQSIVEPSVEWQVALDPELRDVVQSGEARALAEADHTVKVDVVGLAAGTTYYYRFRVAGAASPVGRTRTAPLGHVERLRIAVTSCANYPQGFFHAYRKIAERADLDLVLYLGDYLYEYANGAYGDGAPIGRVPDPDRETISLDDYRRRHAQYKLDPDLQAVHQQHAAVVVWDDHEVANDAFKDGAQNHTPGTEGDWAARKAAAERAYHEWMPIRSTAPGDLDRIYRVLSFGDLADLIMLDTRLVGRDAQVADACDRSAVDDPARSILGAEQERWLLAELDRSKSRQARYRLIGQQVPFGQFMGDPPEAGCVKSRDKWGAYAASRARVLDHVAAGGIDNVVILTGDAHSSWGLDIARDPFDPSTYDPATGRGSLAVEIIVPGVSSPGMADAERARASEAHFLATHPHIRYANQHERGYALLDVTHARLQAEWYYVSSVRDPEAREQLGAAVACSSGLSHLVLSDRLALEQTPAIAPAPGPA